MLRDLRAVLGPDVPIVGHAPIPAGWFANAGSAARGMLGSWAGLITTELGATGQRFVRDFGATQADSDVDVFAVYAAAATEVLLDAIARSDGTRASVAHALAETDLPDSVIGPITLDRNGEPTTQPITILRLERGGGDPLETFGIEGSEFVDVITPPARLVGAPASE